MAKKLINIFTHQFVKGEKVVLLQNFRTVFYVPNEDKDKFAKFYPELDFRHQIFYFAMFPSGLDLEVVCRIIPEYSYKSNTSPYYIYEVKTDSGMRFMITEDYLELKEPKKSKKPKTEKTPETNNLTDKVAEQYGVKDVIKDLNEFTEQEKAKLDVKKYAKRFVNSDTDAKFSSDLMQYVEEMEEQEDLMTGKQYKHYCKLYNISKSPNVSKARKALAAWLDK